MQTAFVTAEIVEGALGGEEAVGPKREWEGTRSLLTQYLTQLPSAALFPSRSQAGQHSVNEALLTQDLKLCRSYRKISVEFCGFEIKRGFQEHIS